MTNERENRRRVVVTGYGMLTPLGTGAEQTFDRAARGLSGIDYIKSFDTAGLPCRIGGEVDEDAFDRLNRKYHSGKLEKYLSKGLKLMRAASYEAAQMARLSDIADRSRVGMSLGSHGDNSTVQDITMMHRFYDGQGQWDLQGLDHAGGYQYLNFFRRKSDVATSALSMIMDLKGPNITTVSACSAGPQAIGEAYYLIQEGRAEAMLAGGCEATLNYAGFVGFILITAMSEKYADPQSASRPFDRKRNGFVMSEGASAVVLEELQHARARGATIYGEVLGYGSSADAYRITDTHPKGRGAIIAMRAALRDAGLGPDDVDYVNAHGTSTTQNDKTETYAIKEVLGQRAKEVPVSSNKSMLGHTIAAAGAIECILSLMGVERSTVLPTINYETRDPKCDLDYVPGKARRMEHSTVLSNSFGFGGQNACLCLGRLRD